MKKQIKKYGNSLVIKLDKDEIEWYNLHEGDWLDLSDFVIIKKGVKKK
jgi:antitoxin component of MazEF toxin-antitoxin module